MTIALVDAEGGAPTGGGNEVTSSTLGVKVVRVKLDTSYPTGGTPGVKAILGIPNLIALIPLSNAGYHIEYVNDQDKLKVYQQPAAAAAGASPEVPNTTNLSAIIIRCLAISE